MSTTKGLPWLSLLLIVLTYGSLGWTVSQFQFAAYAWVLIATAILFLVALLTHSWSAIARYSKFIFKSNTRSFAIAVVGAFIIFLMTAWFRVFLDTLLVVAATILMRIDLQTVGLREGKIFLLVSFLAALGFALGVFIHKSQTYIAV
ncbi:hypothetical protein [Calothrix sp. PCC 6303]|uniref:hypothetical protein n=1 Tax=Calothrix sp. PCC 6303 TaxID=1170562 RepID=UPI0002A00960|nr:hypothetical protein [Calothrix sp. PCC 6303]AFZ03566.1 hypothetical protein Cal6303_4666 [Calothrix sp. PCC 6303]